MQERQEIDIEGLKSEASEFNLKEKLDELNQLIKIDQEGRLKDGKNTSTIEISGTKANKSARKLGFIVTPKQPSPKKSK